MSLTFERLESRRLLTATAVRNESTLLISGDIDADRIVVSGDGGPGRIDVELGGDSGSSNGRLSCQ